jgi:hypothetical protein
MPTELGGLESRIPLGVSDVAVSFDRDCYTDLVHLHKRRGEEASNLSLRVCLWSMH